MAENRQFPHGKDGFRRGAAKGSLKSPAAKIPCKIIALHMQQRSSCTATNPILQRGISAYMGSMIPAQPGKEPSHADICHSLPASLEALWRCRAGTLQP
jgi:hypothetical protein